MLCEWDHCVILGGCLFYLSLCSRGFTGFAEVESSISVDVIWMHLNFDGFSDETIRVAGYRTQTTGNYPKENILHKEHGESLK